MSQHCVGCEFTAYRNTAWYVYFVSLISRPNGILSSEKFAHFSKEIENMEMIVSVRPTSPSLPRRAFELKKKPKIFFIYTWRARDEP